MKTATFIKNLDGWNGEAKLYHLSDKLDGNEYVIVSRVNVKKVIDGLIGENILTSILLRDLNAYLGLDEGWETYIYPSNKDGEVLSFKQLKDSLRGDYTHEKTLELAGYKVIANG